MYVYLGLPVYRRTMTVYIYPIVYRCIRDTRLYISRIASVSACDIQLGISISCVSSVIPDFVCLTVIEYQHVISWGCIVYYV